MRPPPLLLGAALLFWSAQSDHWIAGGILAVLIELPNLISYRSNLSRSDFDHVWDLCVVLFVAGAFYCYMTVELLRLALVFTEWTPVIFAPMALAQAFSTSPLLPLGVFSWFLRKDRQKPQEPRISTGFFFLAICLLAASASTKETASNQPLWNQQNQWFYPGFSLLVGWCLWGFRPGRYAVTVWVALFLTVASAGYVGQSRLTLLQTYIEGQVNSAFARFMRRLPDANESWTSIGAVGRRQLSARIALRLSTKGTPPPLLREATFNIYGREVWHVGPGESLPRRNIPNPLNGDPSQPIPKVGKPISDAVFSTRADGFNQVMPENANNSSWLLHNHQTNVATVRISTYLPGGKGVLALPTGVFRLDELPVTILSTNRFAAVKVADGPGLVSFDARYAPRIVLGPPPEGNDSDVPEEEKPALDRVVSDLNLTRKNLRGTLQILGDYFQREFTYSTYQPPPDRTAADRTNTPLARFLLTTKSGHCEYFATATTLLLRRAGFQARYAVGYAVAGHPDSSGEYLVRERDAHAWCQVHGDDGWVDFDTTPTVWEEVERGTAHFWEPIYDWLSGIWFNFSKWRWLGSREAMLHLFWLFIPVIALMTWRIISAARQHKKLPGTIRPVPTAIRPGLDSEFYRFEQRLKEFGLERQSDEAVRPWIDRIRSRLPPELPFPVVQSSALLHYRYRFDPEGISAQEKSTLSQNIRNCLVILETHGPNSVRARTAW